MTLLSPTDYYTKVVTDYPSLYASPTYDDSRLQILDHLLNVIGNGLNINSLYVRNSFRLTKAKREMANKFMSCSAASMGFYEVNVVSLGGKTFTLPVGKDIISLIEDKDKHPTVVYWLDFVCHPFSSFYPNFEKKYSFVYNEPIHQLTKEWKDEFIWFYNKCLEYFSDPEKYNTYHTAYPLANDNKSAAKVKETKDYFAKNKCATPYDISKIFGGVEFIGDPTNDSDVAEYLSRKWIKSRAQIIQFIIETIEFIENEMH